MMAAETERGAVATYRVSCGSNFVVIVANSPRDAVSRVKDLKEFKKTGEQSFAVYEVVGFDRQRFAARKMTEEQRLRAAKTRFLETIIVRDGHIEATLKERHVEGE